MEQKIGNLKAGMESVNVSGRVLQVGEQKVVQTRNGQRTIREVILGDDTGRVKLTLWGNQGDNIKEGQVIKVENGWTTAFKGQVQLNAGSKSKISEGEEEGIPQADEIPETMPEDHSPQPRRNFRRGGFRGGRNQYRRRPQGSNYGGEEEE
ncbi:single-stranded DNA-binding protein [Acidianus sulfidivorans JP7]|uniref:Single-stranded DNA-binding protein n=1 Tax=Acidianus sulfidivorans JP7 TaxID=619593 RepID=A0A2U9IKX7_9CREN|nr:OB-fold nucleic acid binding domain-containing protein [Acidianus sulfidivorans]AWR96673.1 single-stranded DNA-binding protein [Acidianus sulfidivorans JP7]